MEEGTSKAIPLRRSRNGARTAGSHGERRWSDAIAEGVRRITTPPRQLWLATLGTTALAVRGTRAAWERLVDEGTTAETWLRQHLGRGSESATT
jgi:hypothetical protein